MSERLVFNKAQNLRSLWKKRLRFWCFAVDSVKFLRNPLGDCCYLWKELKVARIVESPVKSQSSKKEIPLLTKFSSIIVRINAFIASIFFLKSALQRQLSYYFFHTYVSGCSNMKGPKYLPWLNLRLWNWKSRHLAFSWFF